MPTEITATDILRSVCQTRRDLASFARDLGQTIGCLENFGAGKTDISDELKIKLTSVVFGSGRIYDPTVDRFWSANNDIKRMPPAPDPGGDPEVAKLFAQINARKKYPTHINTSGYAPFADPSNPPKPYPPPPGFAK